MSIDPCVCGHELTLALLLRAPISPNNSSWLSLQIYEKMFLPHHSNCVPAHSLTHKATSTPSNKAGLSVRASKQADQDPSHHSHGSWPNWFLSQQIWALPGARRHGSNSGYQWLKGNPPSNGSSYAISDTIVEIFWYFWRKTFSKLRWGTGWCVPRSDWIRDCM